MEVLDPKQLISGPRISSEAGVDFLRVIGTEDEQNVGGTFKGTTQKDDAFGVKNIHEAGVGGPITQRCQSSQSSQAPAQRFRGDTRKPSGRHATAQFKLLAVAFKMPGRALHQVRPTEVRPLS